MPSFSGRSIPDPGFAGDQGLADPRLAAALSAAAADPSRRPEVLAALHGARVLTPVVAVLGEVEVAADGFAHDTSSDMALPLLVAEDGGKAVPIFSSLQALADWDPTARPVPVEATRAAAVALAEGAEAAVLDLASPHRVTLGLPELRALVEGRGVIPPYADDAVRFAIHQALDQVPAVARAWLEPCPGADGRLTVQLNRGGDPAAVAGTVSAAMQDIVRRATVRGFDLAVLSSKDLPPAGRKVYARRF